MEDEKEDEEYDEEQDEEEKEEEEDILDEDGVVIGRRGVSEKRGGAGLDSLLTLNNNQGGGGSKSDTDDEEEEEEEEWVGHRSHSSSPLVAIHATALCVAGSTGHGDIGGGDGDVDPGFAALRKEHAAIVKALPKVK